MMDAQARSADAFPIVLHPDQTATGGIPLPPNPPSMRSPKGTSENLTHQPLPFELESTKLMGFVT